MYGEALPLQRQLHNNEQDEPLNDTALLMRTHRLRPEELYSPLHMQWHHELMNPIDDTALSHAHWL